MPAEEQPEAGVEAIMLSRRALEIHTQLYGTESREVADDKLVLASALDYFNDVDDDEILHLYEQANATFARVDGSMSTNVAACECNVGIAYGKRAKRAQAAHDLDRYVANLELALPRHRESVRIYRAINHTKDADDAAKTAVGVEKLLREAAAIRAAITTRG